MTPDGGVPAPLTVTLRGATKLLDMREGYAPIRNILGMSDPSVHLVDGRWTMFIGGMGPRFRTNIYRATLPQGAPIDADRWTFDMAGRFRARSLVPQPPRGAWNRCMHSVCYVKGEMDGAEVERIYHAGRPAETVLSTTAPYRIGYLEKRDGEWVSCAEPLVLEGLIGHVGVLEPKVEYRDGLWHMRYLALTSPGDDPDGRHTLLSSVSEDGRTGWSTPTVFADSEAGFFDSVSVPFALGDRKGHLMVLTRSGDFDDRSPYDSHGMWWSSAPDYSGDPARWTPPVQFLDAAASKEDWYGRGTYSPSLVWNDEEGQLEVFFAASPRPTSWLRLARENLARWRPPPVPSPLYFTIGRATVDVRPARG